MKIAREAMPKVTENTYLQKVIPPDDIEKYVGEKGWNTIRGYISRYDDVSHIKGYDNIVEALRLDYEVNGVRPFPEGGNSYGYIIFKSDEAGKLKIPYGEAFGGNNPDGPPCTGNGFLASEKEIIPEWHPGEERVKPSDGAELHSVVGGEDKIIAIFNGKYFEPIGGE